MGDMSFRYSLLTSHNPARLAKLYELDPSGVLQKSHGGPMLDGFAVEMQTSSLDELARLITQIRPNQALIFGHFPEAECHVITKKRWKKRGCPKGVYTRSGIHVEYGSSPGVFYLDIDWDETAGEVTYDRVLEILKEVAPGIFAAGGIINPSSSSFIFHGNKQLTGLRGFHIYVPVFDASDIPRAGAALMDRLWLLGYGRIKISVCGGLLDRSIVDGLVWQAERLAFAGGAECKAPLSQQRGDPVILPSVDGQWAVDTRKVLPDVSPREMETLLKLKEKAKSEKRMEAATVRDAWLARRSQADADSDMGDGSREEKIHRARRRLERALDQAYLDNDFILYIAEEGEPKAFTVGEVLADRERFDSCDTLDPLDPGYDDGRVVGKLFLLQVTPRLHSFAMGGRTFELGRQKKTLLNEGGNTHELVDQVIRDLQLDGDLFLHGPDLVEVVRGGIMAVKKHSLENYLGHQYRWKVKIYKGVVVTKDPPIKVCQQILHMGSKCNLRDLKQMITAPIILPSGRLISAQGFDSDSGLYLYCPELDGKEFQIPDNPTQNDINISLARLMFPFQKFPFCTNVDRSVYLAALLTAVLRPGLPLSPGFGLDAPCHGSGKTVLGNCLSLVATGKVDTMPPLDTADESEIRKRLHSIMMGGLPFVLWDNVTEVLDSGSMASLLTAETYTDRVLGVTQTGGAPNRTMFVFTGNNLIIGGELPRRVAISRIDLGNVDPYSRIFELNPQTHCRMNRLQMVRAALTLIRGYQASGVDPAPGRVSSFETWDALVRQPVAWIAGFNNMYDDPIKAFLLSKKKDPSRERDAELLAALHVLFGDGVFTARQVHDASEEFFSGGICLDANKKRVALAIKDLKPASKTCPTPQQIGSIFRYRKDRSMGGAKLVEIDSDRDGAVWQVVIVD